MRRINDAGLAILKSFETCQLRAYKDQGGIWTIGWGHTGPEVVEGLEIDAGTAESLLLADLSTAENAVLNFVKIPLTDNQFSSLVVFVFNVGINAFIHSKMLFLLNEQCSCADQFDEWIHVHGKISNGLVKRRSAEKDLFLTT